MQIAESIHSTATSFPSAAGAPAGAGSQRAANARAGLSAIRERFQSGLAARLAAMEQMIDDVGASSAARNTEMLSREFHNLAGLGGTFGYSGITRLALHGEKRAENLAHLSDEEGVELLRVIRMIGEETPDAISSLSAAVESEGQLGVTDAILLMSPSARRTALAHSLEAQGYLVTTPASSGAGQVLNSVPAITVIDTERYDDYRELVGSLRKQSNGDSSAVVLLGSVDRDGLLSGIACGADLVVSEDADVERISAAINEAITTRHEGRVRVLSVEDDPLQAAIVRSVLETANFSVRVCNDPDKFERDLAGHRPDLVLMDINMPGTDGYELARSIRRNQRMVTLPIIFLTARDEASAKIEAMRAGGDDHLSKPIVPALLISAVATRVERARMLRQMMTVDTLTGVSNRATIFSAIDEAFATAGGSGRTAALVMLDVDHFKSVNDTYGHQTGDYVLSALGRLLPDTIRRTDEVGRYGGEEFCVILFDVDAASAARSVGRMLERFAAIEHTSADGRVFNATFSAGISLLRPNVPDVRSWIESADKAMYEAKHRGRNQFAAA